MASLHIMLLDIFHKKRKTTYKKKLLKEVKVMKHIIALLIKFLMVSIVLVTVLSMLTNLTFSDMLYISGTVTILAYVIGDMLILRMSNNIVATIADAGLALFTIYMFNYLWNIQAIDFTDALIAAAILGVGEWFFHKYVANNVFHEHQEV
jgi:Protein of unknown function (DUF2512)